MQLLLHKWVSISEGKDGQKKLKITQDGLVFLEKSLELQGLVGIKNSRKPLMPLTSTKQQGQSTDR
jgi:hypothetical protein